MRRLLAVTVAVLIAPAAAAAKGLEQVQVCGSRACTDITDRAGYGVVEGGGSAGPDRALPFVEIRATFVAGREKDVVTFQFVPAAGLSRNEEGLWHQPDAATTAVLREAAGELEPFPASKLDRLAPEIAANAALAQREPPTPRAPDGGSFPWPQVVAGAIAALLAAKVLTVRQRRTVPAP